MVTARRHGKQVKVRNLADLQEIVRLALQDGEPLVLVSEHDEEIVFDPPNQHEGRHAQLRIERENADRQAFLASAGGWQGLVDGEELKARIRESRGSDRPAVKFDESSK